MKRILVLLIPMILCISFALALTGCSQPDSSVQAGGEEAEAPEDAGSGDAGAADSTDAGTDDSASYGALSEGDEAPDFTAELAGGGTFSLADHKDEVVLINFWATWCPPCVYEMPELQKIWDQDLQGFTMIGVDCAEDKGTVDQFIKENGYTFNIAYDEDRSIEMKYPTSGIPYTLIIKNGVIRNIFLGVPQDAYSVYLGAVEDCLSE